MTTTRMMMIVLGAATVGAMGYALLLLPSTQKPTIVSPTLEAPAPTVTEVPPVAQPVAPAVPSVAPLSPPKATPAVADPAALANAPTSLEELRITEAEEAEIKPVISAARDQGQRILNDLKAGRISIKDYGDATAKGEAEVIAELGHTLGAERAKQFVRLSRGRLPERFEKHEASKAENPAAEVPPQ